MAIQNGGRVFALGRCVLQRLLVMSRRRIRENSRKAENNTNRWSILDGNTMWYDCCTR
jgi:hypothetical protein